MDSITRPLCPSLEGGPSSDPLEQGANTGPSTNLHPGDQSECLDSSSSLALDLFLTFLVH